MKKIYQNSISQMFAHLSMGKHLRIVTLAYNSLFVAHVFGKQPRALRQAIVMSIAVVLIGFSCNWQLISGPELPFMTNDGHALQSFEIAVNRVACGTLSSISEEPSIRELVKENTNIVNEKILSLPQIVAGTTEAYCKNTTLFLNNENSLMWMIEATLRVAPNITFKGLALTFQCLRVASLVVFVFFLLRIGLSPLFGFAAFTVGLIVIAQMYLTHYFSLYPFLMPFTVLLIALLGLALSFSVHRRVGSTCIVLTSIGVFGAFLSNLRSSYYPVILACLLLYVVFATIDLRRLRDLPRPRQILLPGLAVLCFFIGMGAFKTVLLKPLENNIKTGYNASYHVIAHPLVLSLALTKTENALSRREEIKWDDLQGLVLARRIDPTVKYLSPNYEKALFTYYKKLWREYPGEMLGIYTDKLLLAGHSAQDYVKANFQTSSLSDQFVRAIFRPMSFLAHGGAYLAMFVGTASVGVVSLRFMNLGAAFALTALAGTAILLLLESAIIMPFFMIIYHNYLLFWYFCMGLLLYQLGFNLLLVLGQMLNRSTHQKQA